MRKAILGLAALLLFTAQAEPECGGSTLITPRPANNWNQVKLTMEFPPDAQNYIMYRADNGGGWQQMTNHVPAGQRDWVDGGGIVRVSGSVRYQTWLYANSYYQWRVCPYRVGSQPGRFTPLPCAVSRIIQFDASGRATFD